MKEREARIKAFRKKADAYDRRWNSFETGLAKLMAKHGVENYATVAFLKREPGMGLSDESGWHEILKAKHEMRTPMSWMVLSAYKNIVLTGAPTDGRDLEKSL
jgi:hypothetical protein